LIEVRQLAREAKQFQIADRVRDRLTELGFVLEDRQDGTGWRRA
jgi:cysteinyl-tRNA synthetase